MDRLALTQGSTFSQVVRWGIEPIQYKPITGITQSAPAVVTCPGHGLPPGWPVAVVSVKGMTEINAKSNPPRHDPDPYLSDYKPATIEDANSISLNHVNAADFKPYVSGGYLQCFTPASLENYTARLSIKDKKGGTELLSLTTENGGLLLDEINFTITIRITAAQTAGLTIKKGVFDLEMVAPDGVTVTAIMSGTVTVAKEVTT